MVKKIVWALVIVFLLNVGFGYMSASIYNHKVNKLESEVIMLKEMMIKAPDIQAQYYVPGIRLNKHLQLHTYLVCKKYNLDYKTALSMMYVESRFDVNAKNTSNSNGTTDYGVMQINTVNLERFYNMAFEDIMNPYENISFGLLLLKERQEHFNNESYAVASYNMGINGFSNLMAKGQDYTQYSLAVMDYKNKLNKGEWK